MFDTFFIVALSLLISIGAHGGDGEDVRFAISKSVVSIPAHSQLFYFSKLIFAFSFLISILSFFRLRLRSAVLPLCLLHKPNILSSKIIC